MSLLGMYWIQICEIGPEPDVFIYLPAYPMMCMKLHILCVNCSVLMSVIWLVLLLSHILCYCITCLFECQLMLTSDGTIQP